MTDQTFTPEYIEHLARLEAETAAEVGRQLLVILHDKALKHAALAAEAVLLDRCDVQVFNSAIDLAAAVPKMIASVEKFIGYYTAKERERDGATTH